MSTPPLRHALCYAAECYIVSQLPCAQMRCSCAADRCSKEQSDELKNAAASPFACTCNDNCDARAHVDVHRRRARGHVANEQTADGARCRLTSAGERPSRPICNVRVPLAAPRAASRPTTSPCYSVRATLARAWRARRNADHGHTLPPCARLRVRQGRSAHCLRRRCAVARHACSWLASDQIAASARCRRR